MTKKQRRHAVLRQILQGQSIRSQADLQDALSQQGVQVSQATLSRDIKELGLIKTPLSDERYQYVAPERHMQQRRYERLETSFRHFVTGYDHAENLVVIKTTSGSAAAVAEDLDAMPWEEVLGTVAGDDTILVVVRSVSAVKQLHERFQRLLGLASRESSS